jgi:hypothetical protein
VQHHAPFHLAKWTKPAIFEPEIAKSFDASGKDYMTPIKSVLHTIILSLFLSVGLTGHTNSSDYSGKVDDAVVRQITDSQAGQLIAVELEMTGAISGRELAQFLDDNYTKLDDKRRAGLRILHQRADSSQRSMLGQLRQLEQDGLAAEIESDWLTNKICVKLTASAIERVAGSRDILSVHQPILFSQIKPEKIVPQSALESETPGIKANLKLIGADTAWQMGYTGEGRVVCTFDMTGVDGHHPALSRNWKGWDGNWGAAWHNGGDSFPGVSIDWEGDSTHGTALIGIMVGHDDSTGDTIGIAPDAKWIASWWPDFGWAADPDGNPNTTADMPDVINLSMGFPSQCEESWNEAIDLVEALGIVVVIAAGNTGSAPYTIWSPASRAEDSLTNFAVGSIDHRSGLLWFSSSRGPSPCDSHSVKPNVCAPGAYIRCAVPGGGYEIRGGTSMAAPHVAGAVAIMRQYAPNATAREIKEALLVTATRRGVTFPNNNYGWGIISIPAALGYLRQIYSPDLKISTFEYDRVKITDTLTARLSLLNRGYTADSVYLRIYSKFPGLRVLTDSIYVGAVGHMQVADGEIPLRCAFSDTLLAGPVMPLLYVVHGAGRYVDSSMGEIKSGIDGKWSEGRFISDRFYFAMGNQGNFWLWQDLVTPEPCTTDWCPDDFAYSIIPNGSLLIGADSSRVSDNYYEYFAGDFWVDAIRPFVVNEPGAMADHETECSYHDGKADNQIGVLVRQHTYGWKTAGNDNYIILQYEFEGATSKSLHNLYAGLALDAWEYYGPDCSVSDTTFYTSSYLEDERMGYFSVDPCELDTTRFFGVALLGEKAVHSFQAVALPLYSYSPTDADKFAAISGGIRDTLIRMDGYKDVAFYLSTGPFSLEPHQVDSATFAIISANSLEELTETAARIRSRWQAISSPQQLPVEYALGQNFPNPFNPSTTIDFDLAASDNVSLIIYNILGEQVAVLENGRLAAGPHRVIWNGINQSGKAVASGIYLYRLTTDHFTQSRKMVLIR